MKSKHNKGFTLLEILVVMVILGVLVTIGLRSFATSQMRARDAKRKRDLEQVVNALEMYRSDKGYYPVSDEGEIAGYNWGEVFNDPDNTETIYMGNLPTDPGGLNYFYQALQLNDDETEAQAYRIYAFLENEQDPDRVAEDDMSADYDGDVISCHPTSPCNYFISTSNLTN